MGSLRNTALIVFTGSLLLVAVGCGGGGSAKNQRIAFQTNRDGNEEVYITSVDGKDYSNLSSSPRSKDYTPTCSKSGRVAFASNRDGKIRIYVTNDQGVPTAITPAEYNSNAPAWSPTDDVIAFVSARSGPQEIYAVDVDGSGETNLSLAARSSDTPSTFSDWGPAWSADSKKIAFASDRDGNQEIYVMAADGSDQNRLTNDPAKDWDPTWSPDGSKIAFVSDRAGVPHIFVMNVDGPDPIDLTPGADLAWSPAWSPDGSKIVFVSDRDGDADIYVMNADGSEITLVTDSPATDLVPAWCAE